MKDYDTANNTDDNIPLQEDEDTASRYFIAFIVVILVILMTVKACCWIYARIALNRQFRLYMWMMEKTGLTIRYK